MNFKFKHALLLTPAAIMPVAMVSCGVDKDTDAKRKQDADFSKDSITQIIEGKWLDVTLKNLYSVAQDQNLISNEAYKADAFAAYQAFVANENLKHNPFYLLTQLNTWAAAGILSNDDQKAFVSFLDRSNTQGTSSKYYKANLNQDQFNVLYNNAQTNVAYTVNKLLLINKYFQISNLADLEKVDSSSASLYKTKFQLDQFNLINYVVNNKTVQLWQYQDSNTNNIFTMGNCKIDTIAQYQDLIKKSTTAGDTATSALLLNQTAPYQSTMGGFKGLMAMPSSFKISYSVDDLLNTPKDKIFVGFYDANNEKIVSVDENGKLASSIAASTDGKTINVAYMSQIAPIGKTVKTKTTEEGKEKEVESKILSFDETPFASDLNQLRILLAVSDDNLYKKAQSAFVALGYVIKVDDALKAKTEGMAIIAK
ncbi:HinT-interacting membrane complex lipoprotein P60 [Mycoplasma sp. VS424B]|uniref:HinT-interacting membrane complex lipoprotein P60 n=1 Tax=unclassified Mycoplasma TaxID=2683645 RepID=UPI003AACC4FC